MEETLQHQLQPLRKTAPLGSTEGRLTLVLLSFLEEWLAVPQPHLALKGLPQLVHFLHLGRSQVLPLSGMALLVH